MAGIIRDALLLLVVLAVLILLLRARLTPFKKSLKLEGRRNTKQKDAETCWKRVFGYTCCPRLLVKGSSPLLLSLKAVR